MPRPPYFSPELFKFLRELKRHNDREWFQENKWRYQQFVRDPFLRFLEAIGRIAPAHLPRHALSQRSGAISDDGRGALSASIVERSSRARSLSPFGAEAMFSGRGPLASRPRHAVIGVRCDRRRPGEMEARDQRTRLQSNVRTRGRLDEAYALRLRSWSSVCCRPDAQGLHLHDLFH